MRPTLLCIIAHLQVHPFVASEHFYALHVSFLLVCCTKDFAENSRTLQPRATRGHESQCTPTASLHTCTPEFCFCTTEMSAKTAILTVRYTGIAQVQDLCDLNLHWIIQIFWISGFHGVLCTVGYCKMCIFNQNWQTGC